MIFNKFKEMFPLKSFWKPWIYKVFENPELVRISGRVDRASATETVDSGSILGWVKSKTTKIDNHSFPAWRSKIKGSV